MLLFDNSDYINYIFPSKSLDEDYSKHHKITLPEGCGNLGVKKRKEIGVIKWSTSLIKSVSI